MFNQLKNEVVNYYSNLITEETESIKEEYGRAAAYWSTATRTEQLKNGVIDLLKYQDLAIKRMAKYYQKQQAEQLKNIDDIENAPDFKMGAVYVNWYKSPVWGYNPRAEFCSETNATTYGSASGCGYDKLSAAVAKALNENKSILKALYAAENKRLSEAPTVSRRDYIGYGSGYGAVPYFEGGVGEQCHINILNKIGLTAHWFNGKNNDTITISK